MCRIVLIVLAVNVVVLAIIYQVFVLPLLLLGGKWRPLESIGTQKCVRDKSLQACEKFVFHRDSGFLYLACSTPYLRSLWLPSVGLVNKSGAGHDYLAVYDTSSSTSTRLPLVRFNHERGLSVLGMDVVPSSESSSELWVYVINNRAPLGRPLHAGADSAVEIFKGQIGEKKLKWVTTVENFLIGTPNDIIGFPDGKSFYITNELKKSGLQRGYEIFMGTQATAVTFCHVENGCRFAATELMTSNGIARGLDGEIFVSSTWKSQISVLEKQADNTLVLTDVIDIGGGGLDNLSVDEDGAIYVAEHPKIFTTAFKHLPDPKVHAPSAVRRITINTDESSFYGEKYKVEKIFEDNGTIASGITTAVWDSKRKQLFLHGVASSALLACSLD